jgi:hypothetical protein
MFLKEFNLKTSTDPCHYTKTKNFQFIQIKKCQVKLISWEHLQQFKRRVCIGYKEIFFN